MVLKIITFLLLMAGVTLCAEGLPSNTAIIQAITANPGLLDSPQAKAVLQNAPAPSSVPTAKMEVPVNTVVPETKGESIPADVIAPTADDLYSLYRSPFTMEKSDEYGKRLLARQIKESPKELKRYGIEFFGNKNGMDLASLPVPENYKLVPKDVLNVVLYGPKSDNMSLTIDKDGSVVIPSFGPLQIAGLSFSEAKKTITDALMAAYPNVGVTVNITQFSTIQVTLAGEVATPGLYNVSSFSTVKEALIAAGGLSKNGSMRSVTIKRQGRVFATIDLYTIIRGTGRSDPLLRAGDIIVVPVMGKSVIIDGDVKRPAIYEAKKNTTIADLIAYAGGIQASASKNDIRITRYEAHQGVKVFNVSLGESAKMVAMDQDKVYVHDLDKSNLRGITLYGNVVKPGFWPLMKEGISIKEFFQREISQNTLRGVFLEDTYFDYAIIKRTSKNLKEEIIGFSLDKALRGEEKILLHGRDELYVLNRSLVEEKSVVKITGQCVAQQGDFKFFENMTLRSLLVSAGLKCPIDERKISVLSRDPKSMSKTVEVVDLLKTSDYKLKRYDEVSVIDFYTTNPVKKASINGEIYVPGTYPISDNGVKLKELIALAGGLTDKASLDKIEIVRYEIINGVRTRKVQNITPAQAMSEDSPVVMGYDEVTVFKIPQWNERKSVKILGKVKYPGEYAIEEGDRLSDVLERAGGFSEAAYPHAAVFTREDVAKMRREGMERQVKDLENRILFSATQPSQLGQPSSDKTQLVSMLDRLKADINNTKIVGRMTVVMDANLSRFQDSHSNVVLKNGDALYVPEKEESVAIQGEVLNPNAVIYDPRMGVEEYLEKAGGVKRSADESNIFVVHANGEAEPYQKGFFFTSSAQVGPGDVIVVPMELRTVSGIQLAKDITSIIYQMAVSVAALKTIGAL